MARSDAGIRRCGRCIAVNADDVRAQARAVDAAVPGGAGAGAARRRAGGGEGRAGPGAVSDDRRHPIPRRRPATPRRDGRRAAARGGGAARRQDEHAGGGPRRHRDQPAPRLARATRTTRRGSPADRAADRPRRWRRDSARSPSRADAGGSIRIPAALCGVVGLKPTFGRVSEHGAATLSWSLAHVGADRRNSARRRAGVSRRWPGPTQTTRIRSASRGRAVSYHRISFRPAEDRDIPRRGSSTRRRKWWRRAGRRSTRLVSLGAEVREVEIPDLHFVRPAHLITAAVEWAAAFAKLSRRERREFRRRTCDWSCDWRTASADGLRPRAAAAHGGCARTLPTRCARWT